MDAFLTSAAGNVNNFIGIWLMKRINTGDRMLDTSIQVLASTFLGALITGFVTMITKSLWKEWWNSFTASFGLVEHNGLEFNPAFAPDKSANGANAVFTFRSKRHDADLFWAWFNEFHRKKRFSQKMTESIILAENVDEKGLLATAVGDGERIPAFDVNNLPIWKSSDGFYVYARGHTDDHTTFYSDSGKAISEACEHIKAYHAKAVTYMETKEKKATSTIREYDSRETRHLGEVQANRRLETMFFSQKEEIVRVLTGFKEKTLFPKHLPIDNKLGILLHGPPGTGKTGFIAAMANFLGRDIMLIHTSRIRRRKHLDELFEFDNSQYIFVFEEFDCMPGVQRRNEAVTDVSGNKVEGTGTKMDSTAYAMMLMAQKEKSDDLVEEMREERAAERDKVDLHYLLTKLDGLQSANERVIVATTNHPERIDPALLRPGRFGIQLNLTNCTRAMLRDLLAMIYQVEGQEKIELAIAVTGIEELKWSPAEILQLGISKKGWAEVVEHMMTQEPSRF